ELLWRKHVALLVYLARSPRLSRTREHLVGMLWSDRNEKQARHSLSEALRVLRRVLGDASVRADVDQVGLVADAVSLDCDRFAELCGRGEWAAATALVACSRRWDWRATRIFLRRASTCTACMIGLYSCPTGKSVRALKYPSCAPVPT